MTSSSPEPPRAGTLLGGPATAMGLRRELGELERGLGCRAWIVGGYVRDLLLGRPARADVDVVLQGAGAREAAEWLRRRWDRRAAVVAFERFGTAQATFAKEGRERFSVEFVVARAEAYQPESRKPEVRKGGADEDAWRRDFTVNALLLDGRGHIWDPTGMGLPDLFQRLLRTPMDPAATFSEDPLRMLRGARFLAQMELGLAPGLETAMAEMAPRLAIVSQERIRDELVKLLVAPEPGRGLRLLLRTGLLRQIAPELAEMAGVDQGGYHLGDVFEHTCLALGLAPAELLVRLAVLFHDVGKPRTRAEGASGPTFLGHPQVGAEVAQQVMGRLRFSGQQREAVAQLVGLHMRPISYREDWSDSAVRRLWHDAGSLLTPLMELAEADTRGSAFPLGDQLQRLRDRLRQVQEEHPAGLASPLGGHRLMAAFDLGPGPWVGRSQRLLLEAVLEGELSAEVEEASALAWLELRRSQWWPTEHEPPIRAGKAGADPA
ncbi:MAG: CCA tRNA nucleotidyltransferase [Candidatus Dormibacteria bacterium]